MLLTNIPSTGIASAKLNAGGKTLTAAQIMAQLNTLTGSATLPAGQMTGLLANGDASPRLLASLNTLLQQPCGDAALTSGLTALLTQYGNAGSQTLAPSIHSLAAWLGTQLSQMSDKGSQTTLEKQCKTLLRQFSQGNGSDTVKQTLANVLQELRQSGGPVTQTTVDDSLQTLLQQVRQESCAQGQYQDLQFGRNVTEFALRLNQQIAEDAARQQMAGGQVTARQQGEQSEHQRREEEQEDVEETRAAGGVSPRSAEGLQMATRATSIVMSSNTSSPRSVSDASGISLYQGDSVFSYGLDVLFTFMQTLSDQANSSYAAMQENSTKSRDAQGHASTVDGILANVSAKGDSSATDNLPDNVMKYIEENHLEISGVCGYNGSGQWVWTKSSNYNQGELAAIKGALDNVANRASDFISTSQLQLQKMMQTYNVCVSLINSLQTMLADMNKTIAQGIR